MKTLSSLLFFVAMMSLQGCQETTGPTRTLTELRPGLGGSASAVPSCPAFEYLTPYCTSQCDGGSFCRVFPTSGSRIDVCYDRSYCPYNVACGVGYLYAKCVCPSGAEWTGGSCTSGGSACIGSNWSPVEGWAQQLDTNSQGDLWAINGSTNNVSMRTRSSPTDLNGQGWMPTPDSGHLTQISVGLQRGHSNIPNVWGIGSSNTSNTIDYRAGITGLGNIGTSWVDVSGGKQCDQVSVSDEGSVWCSLNGGNILRRAGIDENKLAGTAWAHVDDEGGKRIAINAPPGSSPLSLLAYIIDSDGVLKARTGFSSSNPYGTGWATIDSFFKEISLAADGTLWAIDTNNVIKVQTVSRSNPGSAGAWTTVSWGKMPLQISAGAKNIVWGVSTEEGNDVYRRTGFNCP